VLAASRAAGDHHRHGCWKRACAASRQFSCTLKRGKIVLRW